MSTHGDDDSRNDAGGGWLYLLGRIAWRVLQAVLVTACIVLVFGLLGPREHGGKQKAYIASMKADLRNLVTAEESYFADNATFTPTIGNLSYYSQSLGNTVTIRSATGTGWAATAKNNGTTITCGIYVGSATPPIPGFDGQKDGEPRCK